MEAKDFKDLSFEDLKKVFKKKKYSFFENGENNLNIFGVRIKTGTNAFDDALVVAYKNKAGKETVKAWPITTDPGVSYLHNPMNPKGTAILAEGQYRSAYYVSYHQGKYKALCQKGKVVVFRDNNKDSAHDFNPVDKQSGVFGINIHRSNPYNESVQVDKWSAGCQVFKAVKDFDSFMSLVGKSKAIYGNSFTYTLLNGKDFKSVLKK